MCDKIILHLYRCKIKKKDNNMEQIGIVKEIDSLGRIHIPKEIRKMLGLEKNVELVITQEGLLIKSQEYHLVRKP
jgi:AbrB family looped-hinge helix DNA binding protein